QDSVLPPLKIDEEVDVRELEAIGHETKPPARYTEATLVKALEAEGIGRPSTYATVIDTIQERGYVFKQRKELVPTFVAFAVTQLLEDHFDELVDLRFTAEMEQKLDDIADGQAGWLEYLRNFFLGQAGLENQVKEKEAGIEARIASQVNLADLNAELRIGQFGPFLARGSNGDRQTAGLPDSLPPADLTPEMVEQLFNRKGDEPETLGTDPESELPIFLKDGPYGPYVQLGEEGPKGKNGKPTKPKRASLLKGMEKGDVDLNLALRLLSLPRTLGEHPESGKEVKAGVGRFGPYIVHDSKFVSLKGADDVLEVELERALELLAAAPAKRGSSAKSVIKELGTHPEDGSPIQVLSGRYGPYVNHKKVNATLPKEQKPEEVTLEQALAMLAQKKDAPKKVRRRRG
ncbi:MAG TPA: topoisomerase C-terminal repeat-containing protein, partial [Caldilineaceae bacterium]|nr:topoisomerase C-terminal repeat-containing protein [Caldilineaceae bacterium]